MRVFVTGASGYVGLEVAAALSRRGHAVFGLCRSGRSSAAAARLAQSEVCVLEGDLLQPQPASASASWLAVARSCDVLIHCAANYQAFAELDDAAVATLLDIAADRRSLSSASSSPAAASTVTKVIYTSGILVYPNSPGRVLDEEDRTDSSGGSHFVLRSRLSNEQRVLRSERCCGVVVRPAFVFGRASTHFVPYFAQAAALAAAAGTAGADADKKLAAAAAVTAGAAGAAAASSTPSMVVDLASTSWSQVHIDDLCAAYALICEAPPAAVRGEVFCIADKSRCTNLSIAKAFAAAAGFRGRVVPSTEVKTDERSLWRSRTVIVSSEKAERLLGWFPRQPLLLDNVEAHYRAWRARTGASGAQQSQQGPEAKATATAAASAGAAGTEEAKPSEAQEEHKSGGRSKL